MNEKVQRIKRLVLVNSCFILLPSVVLHYYFGVESNVLFALLGCLCLLIALHESCWVLERHVLVAVVMLCGVGLIGSIFSGTFSQAFMGATLSLNIVIVSCGWRLFVDRRTLRYLMVLSSLMIAGGIIAVSYALSGGSPLATIHLINRESYFYLSTFTDAVIGNLIRPAGIFDEPGALAMFVTVVVALNEAFRVNVKWSAIILFIGLITGSVALLIVLAAYALYKIKRKNLAMMVLILAAVSSLTFLNDRVSTIADEFFFKRIQVVDGKFSGDNRTQQIETFFELVNLDITLRGKKASDSNYTETDQSSNPFSIYFAYGVFMWIPYVVLEIWLLYCSFFYLKHLRFPAMAMFLTLLQRPYIYSLYWAMMIILVVITIYRLQKIETRKVRVIALRKSIPVKISR